MDPIQRKLRAQLGAQMSHANTLDPTSRTAKARAAFEGKFETEARELHPDATDEQIARVAGHLRQAHYKRMTLKSLASRRKGTRAA